MSDLDFEAHFGLVNNHHVHPCETCGNLVDCFDECDEDIQAIVYCRECEPSASRAEQSEPDKQTF
jgi:hypothetical protein